MHAIVILAHFHALASFTYGCGINAEVDSDEGHTTLQHPSPVVTSPSSSPGQHNGATSVEEGGGIEVLMERMRRLNEEAQHEMTSEELQKRFECIETQSAECEFIFKSNLRKKSVCLFLLLQQYQSLLFRTQLKS